MMRAPSEDKQWAQKYILDPLTAPEPHQEDGPGSHFFKSTPSPSPSPPPDHYLRASTASRAPRTPSKHLPNFTSAQSGARYPTPPHSAGPRQQDFHPSNPFSRSYRHSLQSTPTRPLVHGHRPSASTSSRATAHRRTGSSLEERFPGDMSHRPLDVLRQEAKMADRAPHLRKKHRPGADTIDALDNSMGVAYHHEGPYDATLIPRNTNYHTSPVAATMGTNKEALKATPNEYIRDALDKHVPLQGTAVVPSGMPGMDGKMMDYEEGADLMREPDAPGGAYRRWEGEKYLPEDLKGKGEPSYSIEKALKDHKHGKQRDPAGGIELQSTSKNGASRQRSVSLASPDGSGAGTDGSNDVRRSHSLKVGEGLKRRFGSLRKLRKQPDA